MEVINGLNKWTQIMQFVHIDIFHTLDKVFVGLVFLVRLTFIFEYK